MDYVCCRFISSPDRLPWDLDDEGSRKLVELIIDPHGAPVTVDYESIAESLPDELSSKRDCRY